MWFIHNTLRSRKASFFCKKNHLTIDNYKYLQYITNINKSPVSGRYGSKEVIMLDLTMKDGINFSKKEFERLNQRQKKSVLEIMGGKTWLIKDGCLLVINYNVRKINQKTKERLKWKLEQS